MGNVQITVRMSQPFHAILKRIAGRIGQTVEEYALETLVSFVESIQAAGEDPDMQGSDPGGISCDEELLALARGAKKKKKPFLTDEEIGDLLDRFHACWQKLCGPAAPPRQAVGECKVIRFPRRAGSESQKGA